MNSEHRVNGRISLPLAIIVLTVLAGGAPALAQSGVGGPTKPINHVGGATTHSNPVVPPPKGVTANTVSPNPTPTKPVSNTTVTLTKKK